MDNAPTGSDARTGATLGPLKTWSYLAAQKRRPSEYEIVSVHTLYNNDNAQVPLELAAGVPMNRWYRRYRNESRLRHADWNAFRDPDARVYRSYVAAQDKEEIYVDGLLDQYNALGHDARLAPAWAETLARLYTPLRYLLHAAQMCAAYSVTMAPSSTLANCAVFEMADQFRWVSRVAYRTAELAKAWPGLGFRTGERRRWEEDPAWQPYRMLMEKLLATYDWGESVVALNVVALPAVDAGLRLLADSALEQGDPLTGFLLEAQLKDSARRNRWVRAFMQFAQDQDGSRDAVAEWLAKWQPLGEAAAAAYGEDLPGGAGRAATAIQAMRGLQDTLAAARAAAP
ncbi:MAG: toluene monooxygenase [Nevskia sp.]|nr:toluene monooxygenase [Nevskia sp.]